MKTPSHIYMLKVFSGIVKVLSVLLNASRRGDIGRVAMCGRYTYFPGEFANLRSNRCLFFQTLFCPVAFNAPLKILIASGL